MQTTLWLERPVPDAPLSESIAELHALTGAWLRIYNGQRNHDSLRRVLSLFSRGRDPRPSFLSNCPRDRGAYGFVRELTLTKVDFRFDDYSWRHLAWHMAKAGLADELRALSLDFRWLRGKLKGHGLIGLLDDLALSRSDAAIQEVHSAVRAAAHVLSIRPRELASQIAGRLCESRLPEVRALCNSLPDKSLRPWLRPTTASLGDPGTGFGGRLTGHGGAVNALALSADGSLAVSGGSDRTVRVWDVRRCKAAGALRGHTGEVTSVAVTGDGLLAVSGAKDHTVRVWDTTTGKQLSILDGMSEPIAAVAISNGGERVVAATSNRLLAWNLPLRTPILLGSYTNDSLVLRIEVDGRAIVVYVKEGTKENLFDRETYGDSVTVCPVSLSGPVSISEDLRFAISVQARHAAVISNITTGASVQQVQPDEGEAITAVAMSGDGGVALIASAYYSFVGTNEAGLARGHLIEVWSLDTHQRVATLTGHTAPVRRLATTRGGDIAVSAAANGELRVWHLDSALLHRRIDDRSDITANSETIALRTQSQPVEWICVSDSGAAAVSACYATHADRADGDYDSKGLEVRVWMPHAAEQHKRLHGLSTAAWLKPEGKVTIGVSSDGTFALASWNKEPRIRLWTPRKSGFETDKRELETGTTVTALTVADTVAVSGAASGRCRLWDLETGYDLRGFIGPKASVSVLALSSNKRTLAAGYQTGRLRAWEFSTGAIKHTWDGHSGPVTHIVVSAQGDLIASSSLDLTTRLWCAGRNKPLRSIPRRLRLSGIALTSSGQIWTLECVKNEIRLWNEEGPTLVATLTTDGVISASAITPDGNTIVAGQQSGRIHFMRVEMSRASTSVPQPKERVGHSPPVRSDDSAYRPDLAESQSALPPSSRLRKARSTTRPPARNTKDPAARNAAGATALSVVTSGSLSESNSKPLQLAIDAVAISGDGHAALSVSGGPSVSGPKKKKERTSLYVTLWIFRMGTPQGVPVKSVRMPLRSRPILVAMDRKGRYGAVAGGKHSGVRMWDLPAGRTLPIPEHNGRVTAIAIGSTTVAGGTCVVSISANRILKRWDVKSGRPWFDDIRCKKRVIGLAIAESEPIAVTLSRRGKVTAWSLGGKRRRKVKHRIEGAVRVAISRDGGHVGVCSSDGTVCVRRRTNFLEYDGESSEYEGVCSSDLRLFGLRTNGAPVLVWMRERSLLVRVSAAHPGCIHLESDDCKIALDSGCQFLVVGDALGDVRRFYVDDLDSKSV
jgi:WD40 repeat protein